jgi:hypothetical protein
VTARRDAEPAVRLVRWNGPWADDDPDANFKDEVAAYRLLDPLETLEGASASMDIPVGALARYVLAKWSTGGSEGMLHLGSTTVERMHSVCAEAEAVGSDAARLAAFDQLRQMISWLKLPFDEPEAYDA